MPESCSKDAGQGYTTYMWMEFGVKSFPSFLFLITGTYRLCEIKHIGIRKERFSRLFKAKVALCCLMGLIFLTYIPANYIAHKEGKVSSWINQCGIDYFSWFYILQSAAWFLSGYLVIFEYRRSLSEAFYSNKMFWAMSLLGEILIVAVLNQEYFSNYFMLATAFVNIALMSSLIGLMLKTKDPVRDAPLTDLSERTPPSQTRLLEKGCFLLVKFQEKATTINDQNFFQFRV